MPSYEQGGNPERAKQYREQHQLPQRSERTVGQMHPEKIYVKEIIAALDAPKESQEQCMTRIGISLRPITKQEAGMVTDRDFNGSYSPVSTDNLFYRKGLQRTGLFIDDHLVGFAFAGLTEEEGKTIGEISIMYISPAMRDTGLGSLLNAVSKKWLIESDVNLLRSVVMDRSGKINHLLEKQGFTPQGKKGGNPLWERPISSPEEREALLALLDAEIDDRLVTLEQRTDLHDRAEEVERDNPHEVDIEAIVAERVWTENIFDKQSDHTNIFGYSGSEVQLFSSFRPHQRDNQFSIEKGKHHYHELLTPDQKEKQYGQYQATLVLSGADMETARQLLQEEGLEAEYRLWERHNWEMNTVTGITVSGPLTIGNDLRKSAQTLAHLAKRYCDTSEITR